MFYAVDIDGTIANPESALIVFHNQDFTLGLATEELPDTYQHFLHLPQVEGISRAALEQSRQRARMTPEVLLSYDEIEHASCSLRLLAQQGEITYYTVRTVCVEAATHTWLHQKGFPSPHHVVFCRSVLHKLVQLHLYERETSHKIVLIDDRYQQVIADFARLATGEFSQISAWQEVVQFVRQRVLLVAFGATSLPTNTNGLRVLPLQSWKQVVEDNSDLFSCSSQS